MKSAIKAVLPATVLSQLRQWRNADAWRRLHRDWDQAAMAIPVRDVPAIPRSLLILPADPGGIIGSLGDEAMISAALDHFRAGNPDLQVSMMCWQGEAERLVRGRGFQPVVFPSFTQFPGAMAALLSAGEYDALAIFGADVMDGYYSAEYSAQLLAAADLATRSGIHAHFMGFSFNAAPAPELASCFARLDPRVVLKLRDQVSLERIERFAPVRARLVADSAFNLRPGEVDSGTARWIAAEKAAGRRVIGINLHPMLIRDADAAQIGHMAGQMAAAIASANAGQDISWLLVPHDYRDASGDGDGICLRPLLDRLLAMPDIRCRYFEGTHPAATLKALAGQLDGVVTGRMHLAIAALGMGVPVMCLTYQDKFEGLFRHFGLPGTFLLLPSVFETEGGLGTVLGEFLTSLPMLRATIAQHSGKVAALAQDNFAIHTATHGEFAA